MYLNELNKRLKVYSQTRHAEIALFKFLKENTHLILAKQQEQLFHDSEDAEGFDLGFYSYNTKNYNPSKKGGQPFSMIESGSFFDHLTVRVMYRHIEIDSNTPHLFDMLNNPAFESVHFFGLTERSLIWLKQQHTGKFLRAYNKDYLLGRTV